ncbi:MAG: hypothetical protein ACRC5M_04685 [Anaeroplasmataceae bacterium]
MTSKTFHVKDTHIYTTIFDDSVANITDPIVPKRLTMLQPIFASKGKANQILDFSLPSLVKSTYGDDIEDVKKFGQGGLNLIHGMAGGSSAQICRLLPDNATVAAMLVKLVLTEADDIPVYERKSDGSFLYAEEIIDGVSVMKKVQKTTTNNEGVEVGMVTSGLKVKVVFDNKVDPTSTSDGRILVEGKVHSIPLYKLVYNGAGKCGNSIGQSLDNDFDRDISVSDGRRYILSLYELDAYGNSFSLGSDFYFSLNTEALLVEGSSVYENLQYVFTKKDASGNERPVTCNPYIMDNWEAIRTLIEKYCTPEMNPLEVDILNCLDLDKNHYDQFVIEEDSSPIGGDAIYFLDGGSDGDLEVGYKYTKTVDGKPVEITVTEEMVEDTKKSLLKSFFYGQIDPVIFDERMVTSDILYDANYDFKVVKPAMLGKFRSIRPDIMVIADIGTSARNCGNAINLMKSLYDMVDGSAAYSAAVIAHAGYTTDRALNLHVTGTYDYCHGLARCYGAKGTFSVFAGYENGKVQTMEYDWLPYKDEYDTMLGPLTKLGCIYAFKVDRAGNVVYMSESNMYSQPNSKLKSIRNGMVIGDAVRLGKSILIKYSFDNDGAAGAIRKATSDLSENLSGRYPSNIRVTSSLYQSERDKMLDETTCDLYYYFPGMTKGWKLNIYAKRSDV